MAAVATPNLHRAVLPDLEFTYEGEGIISAIDELVERVMSAHMKKALLAPTSEYADIDSTFSRFTSYYTLRAETNAEAAA